jgi:ribosomal protein S18 acetylase RimI-like enzyme
VARRLLAEAEATAARAGLRGVAVDTGLANAPARALYKAYGFSERDVRRAPDADTARAVGGPGFVAYFKSSG